MEYKQLRTSIAEEREKENMRATITEQSAFIDYIAIMTDVDLPTLEHTENNMEEENE